MGVAEFFCNFCFSIHYMVRFLDVYAYTTGCMSCARIFDTSIPRSKNPRITEDVMESTVKKESISKSPTRQRLREKNYPRRTYNSFHVWGYAFKQKKHPLPKYIMLSGRKAFTRSKYCETSTSGTSSTETSCEEETTTDMVAAMGWLTKGPPNWTY